MSHWLAEEHSECFPLPLCQFELPFRRNTYSTCARQFRQAARFDLDGDGGKQRNIYFSG